MRKYNYGFSYVTIDEENNLNTSFDYCYSHKFVFDSQEEKRKLYNGEACFYTDKRYKRAGAFHNVTITPFLERYLSLKACIRRTNKVRNIPVNTIVSFRTDWYCEPLAHGTYCYRIKTENKFDPNYEISKPEYFVQPNADEWFNKIVNTLRVNGFLVGIQNNTGFLAGGVFPGQVVVAYGHNKIIGISSNNETFRGYSDGVDNILYAKFDEFDKWSRCDRISKTENIVTILNILKG